MVEFVSIDQEQNQAEQETKEEIVSVKTVWRVLSEGLVIRCTSKWGQLFAW